MNKTNIRKIDDNYPYDLLLLADETKEGIHKYLFESEVYVAELPNCEAPIGVFCLSPINTDTVEIMNIAVSEQYQNTGIGSRLMTVWESSVKATHHFLKTEDFEFYKKRIPDYFPNVDLYAIRSEETINAFMGVSGDNIEMLFVSAESRGKGYGKSLLLYALNNLNVKKVDVNEQNIQAIGFYERFGFKVIGRSEKDSMGKDYPILHLIL